MAFPSPHSVARDPFPGRRKTSFARRVFPALRQVQFAAAATMAMMLGAAPAVAAGAEAAQASPEAIAFFETNIRPLLAKHCYECHGAKKQKSGLRLDHLADILKGGETGPALVRGKPNESLMIEAVRYKNEDLQMPPDDRLADDEVALLERWVALGAPWPEQDAVRAAKVTDEFGFTAEDRAFWSFQPVGNPTPPAVTGPTAAWVKNDIDRFVAAKHSEHGLTAAPAADRLELVRRVYFDVHGLPPTRAQVEAFLNDSAPDAYARLVDELLASPRYGERWAQHWLDLVRYAESDGYRADSYRPSAWPYRDYVIKSFNADKPYDQFVREQLAGDEIAPGNPDVMIATSYLRNPMYEWNQRDVRGQAELIVTDLTDNAGEVFLGVSLGCARCHDHKFDPILQKDYFSFRAFFEPVLWRSDFKLATAEEQAQYAAQQAIWEAATAKLRAERDALLAPALNLAVKKAYNKFTEDIRGMLDKPAAERAPGEHILATLAQRQLDYEEERFEPSKALKLTEEKVRLRELDAELKKFDHLKPKPLLDAFVATDAGPAAPPTHMKSRRGERDVGPAFLTLLDPKPPVIAPQPNSTGRRSALAAWLTRPDNPLSTRVIVNRVWHYHFGRGLAGTPNDLGHLGERPTHPELLDYLTRKFVANGWSLKQLHREILLSATYQQTAHIAVPERAALVDPTNKFLWRFSPRRLDAEQVRDAILAATGELDLAVGGPGLDAATSSRRSIYTIKRRNNPNELLRSLDAPAGFASIADRQQTSTPLQALLMMNGDWVLARARKLGGTAASIPEVWLATLGRTPTAEETALAENFLSKRIASSQPVGDSAQAEPLAAPTAGAFHENTPQERLVTRGAPKEGDDFTVEAIITLDSVDAGAGVRTIVSRWNGDKSAVEAHGWSLGLAGEKSSFKPRNVVLQLIGEDDNMNTSYEALASGIFVELGQPHYVAARVSCTDRTVTFTVRNLAHPEAPARSATVKHTIVGKVGAGQGVPVIGGLARRTPNQFDGKIEAVHVTAGILSDAVLVPDSAQWKSGLLWRSAQPLDAKRFQWAGGAAVAESNDPRVRAMSDLAHVLLNANEFVYLH